MYSLFGLYHYKKRLLIPVYGFCDFLFICLRLLWLFLYLCTASVYICLPIYCFCDCFVYQSTASEAIFLPTASVTICLPVYGFWDFLLTSLRLQWKFVYLYMAFVTIFYLSLAYVTICLPVYCFCDYFVYLSTASEAIFFTYSFCDHLFICLRLLWRFVYLSTTSMTICLPATASVTILIPVYGFCDYLFTCLRLL